MYVIHPFARLQLRLSTRESGLHYKRSIRPDPAAVNVQQISISSGRRKGRRLLFVPPFSRCTGILNLMQYFSIALIRKILLPFPLGTSDDTSFTWRGVSTAFKAGEQVFSYPLTYSLCLSGWSLRRQSPSSGLRSESKDQL